MSWENVSVSPRKLKKYIIESEKPEIIQTDEIPPNDFSAEAVAKSLLHVSPISVVVFIFCTNFWIKSFFLFPCDLQMLTLFYLSRFKNTNFGVKQKPKKAQTKKKNYF